MTFFKTILVSILSLTLLSACGFQPMYSENTSSQPLADEFATISIGPIEERLGQVVRNHLLDRINPMGEPAVPEYLLRVSLDQSLEGYGFRSDEAITRESMTLTAIYQLVEQSSGKVVLQDEVRAIQAYDVVQSDFANFSAQQDAENRTALRVAEMLVTRLGLYFKSES